MSITSKTLSFVQHSGVHTHPPNNPTNFSYVLLLNVKLILIRNGFLHGAERSCLTCCLSFPINFLDEDKEIVDLLFAFDYFV